MRKKYPLTKRQLEVLALYASNEDLTTAEMAERLGIEANTVRTHASNIMLKLNVKRMRTAVAWYIRVFEGGKKDGRHRRDRKGDGAPSTSGVAEAGAGEGANPDPGEGA